MTPRNALTTPRPGDKFSYRATKDPNSELRTINVIKVDSERVSYELTARGTTIQSHCKINDWLKDWPSYRVETITFGSSPIDRDIYTDPRSGDIVIYQRGEQNTTTLVVVLVENQIVYYQRVRDGFTETALEKCNSLDNWSEYLNDNQITITNIVLAPQPKEIS